MRVHKTRDAVYDIDKERTWNWFRPGKGDRRVGPCHQLTRQELEDFAQREGLELSPKATFATARHS